MCLCLGPPGSGKTLLLRRLQRPNLIIDSAATTVPTVGSNLATLQVGKGRKEVQIEIRELGGAMAPMWPSYYTYARTIIYVMDAADPTKIAAASLLLFQLLSHPKTRECKFLVVLSKSDVVTERSLRELQETARLVSLEREVAPRLVTLQASARSGDGMEDILKWLDQTEGRAVRMAKNQPPVY